MTLPDINELELLHNNICRALGDPTRIQLLYALDEQPTCVGDLADVLDLPQSTTSRHLAVLRQSALVSTERDGTTVVYSIADRRIIEILDQMRAMLRDILARRASYLD